ncbi:MAG: hypothetical protein ACFBZ8_10370 [Opitutales bacterium]
MPKQDSLPVWVKTQFSHGTNIATVIGNSYKRRSCTSSKDRAVERLRDIEFPGCRIGTIERRDGSGVYVRYQGGIEEWFSCAEAPLKASHVFTR